MAIPPVLNVGVTPAMLTSMQQAMHNAGLLSPTVVKQHSAEPLVADPLAELYRRRERLGRRIYEQVMREVGWKKEEIAQREASIDDVVNGIVKPELDMSQAVNFTICRAENGFIVEMREPNPSSDPTSYGMEGALQKKTVFVVNDEEDLGARIQAMVTRSAVLRKP